MLVRLCAPCLVVVAAVSSSGLSAYQQEAASAPPAAGRVDPKPPCAQPATATSDKAAKSGALNIEVLPGSVAFEDCVEKANNQDQNQAFLEARFPFKPDGGAEFAGVRFRVQSVREVNRGVAQPVPELVGRFTVHRETSHDRVDALVLRAKNTNPPLRAGDYDATVVAYQEGDAKAVKALTLRAARLPAQLEVPASFVVEKVSWTRASDSLPQLRLVEVGKRTGLSEVSVVQTGQTTLDALHHQGSIKLAVDPKDAEPGTTLLATPALLGTFPLGTSKGTLRVMAPQLEKDLTIPFEVRHRRDPWVILPVVAIGVLIGMGVRTSLPAVIGAEKLRLQAIDFLAVLDREHEQRADATFRTSLGTARATLVSAIDGTLATANLDGARLALKNALQDLATRRDDAGKSVRALLDLSRNIQSLPDNVTQALKTARPTADLASQALVGLDDAAGASQQVKDALEVLFASLSSAGKSWRISMDPVLSLEALPLPDEMRSATAAKLSGFRSSLATLLNPLNAAHSVDNAELFLKQTRTLRDEIEDFLRHFTTELARQAEEAVSDFDLLAPRSKDERKNVGSLTQQLRGAMDSNNLEVAVAGIEQQADKVVRTVQQALRGLISLLPTSQNTEEIVRQLEGDVEAGKYKSVAKRLRAALPKQPVQLDKSAAGAPDEKVIPWSPPAPPAAAPPIGPSPPLVLKRIDASAIQARRTRSLDTLSWAKFILAVLTGVVIGVLSYAVFAEKFVGTNRELAVIFLWAFVLDVTADRLVELAKTAKM